MVEKLNKIMENIKRQNPNANWANLLTGAAVLVMVAVFSYAYFTKSKANNAVDLNRSLDEVTKQVPAGGSAKGDGEESGAVDQNADTMPNIPAEPGEKGSEVTGETTVVQKGEGLWQVAQRVCGDGEKYNVLANANGLSVWDELNEGMTLKVVCQ